MNKEEIINKLKDWTIELEQIQRDNEIHAKQMGNLILQMQDVNKRLKEML